MPRGMPHCCSSYGQLRHVRVCPTPATKRTLCRSIGIKSRITAKPSAPKLLGDKYKDMPSTPEAARRKPTHTKREYFDAAVSLLKGKRK